MAHKDNYSQNIQINNNWANQIIYTLICKGCSIKSTNVTFTAIMKTLTFLIEINTAEILNKNFDR